MGRRINKSISDTTTWYLWNGNDLIAEYDNTGTRTKRYAYLSESYAPAQMEDVNGTYNVHADHLQTPRFLTNGAKQVVWQATHQAFGEAVIDNNPDGDANVITFVFRRPGQQYDSESGYFYNHFRTYDPTTGRYVTADPIGLIAGRNASHNLISAISSDFQRVPTQDVLQEQGVNHLHIYALNNPLKNMDPTGEFIPAAVWAAFYVDCFNKCIVSSATRVVCMGSDSNVYAVCAVKCIFHSINPVNKLRKIKDYLRDVFRKKK